MAHRSRTILRWARPALLEPWPRSVTSRRIPKSLSAPSDIDGRNEPLPRKKPLASPLTNNYPDFGQAGLVKIGIPAIMPSAPKGFGRTSFRQNAGRGREMRMDARSIRIGRHILLIALAIHGFTPDFRNLSPRWLIQLLTCKSAEFQPGGGSSPLPGEDHHEGPDHACAPVSIDASPRIRLESSARPCAAFTPVSPCERWIPSTPVSLHLFGIATRGSHDLIRSLCRFLF
jgi:hypothetical protein